MSYTLHCTFKRESANAVLVVDTDSGEELWIPLSQVDSMSKDRDGVGTITISDWIARTKGLT